MSKPQPERYCEAATEDGRCHARPIVAEMRAWRNLVSRIPATMWVAVCQKHRDELFREWCASDFEVTVEMVNG